MKPLISARNSFAAIAIAITCFTCSFALADPKPAPNNAQQQEIGNKSEFVAAYEATDWAKVIQLGEELVKTEPDNVVYWTGLGVAYAQTEKPEKALEAFKKEAEIGGDNPENQRNIALLSLDLKTPDAADRARIACKSSPDFPELFYQTGQYLVSKGSFDEGVTYLQKANELDPKSLIYLTGVTSAYAHHNNYERVEFYTKKAIDDGIKSPILYINIVIACQKQGKYEEAIAWANKGYELYKDPMLSYHLGRTQLMQGKYAEAEASLKLNLTGEKMYPELGKALMMQACDDATFKTCSTEQKAPCCEKLDEAISYFSKAEEAVSAHERVLYAAYYAMALAISGQPDAAIALARATSLKVKTADDAILALSLSISMWLSPAEDKQKAKRLYSIACSILPALKDIDSAAKTYHFPVRAVEIVKQIQQDSAPNAAATSKQSACGCSIKSPNVPSIFGVFLAIFGILGLVSRRKRS